MELCISLRGFQRADQVKLVQHPQHQERRERRGEGDDQDGKGVVAGGEHERQPNRLRVDLLTMTVAKPVPSSSPKGTAINARMTNSVTRTAPTSRREKPITRSVASSRARSASEMRALL